MVFPGNISFQMLFALSNRVNLGAAAQVAEEVADQVVEQARQVVGTTQDLAGSDVKDFNVTEMPKRVSKTGISQDSGLLPVNKVQTETGLLKHLLFQALESPRSLHSQGSLVDLFTYHVGQGAGSAPAAARVLGSLDGPAAQRALQTSQAWQITELLLTLNRENPALLGETWERLLPEQRRAYLKTSSQRPGGDQDLRALAQTVSGTPEGLTLAEDIYSFFRENPGDLRRQKLAPSIVIAAGTQPNVERALRLSGQPDLDAGIVAELWPTLQFAYEDRVSQLVGRWLLSTEGNFVRAVECLDPLTLLDREQTIIDDHLLTTRHVQNGLVVAGLVVLAGHTVQREIDRVSYDFEKAQQVDALVPKPKAWTLAAHMDYQDTLEAKMEAAQRAGILPKQDIRKITRNFNETKKWAAIGQTHVHLGNYNQLIDALIRQGPSATDRFLNAFNNRPDIAKAHTEFVYYKMLDDKLTDAKVPQADRFNRDENPAGLNPGDWKLLGLEEGDDHFTAHDAARKARENKEQKLVALLRDCDRQDPLPHLLPLLTDPKSYALLDGGDDEAIHIQLLTALSARVAGQEARLSRLGSTRIDRADELHHAFASDSSLADRVAEYNSEVDLVAGLREGIVTDLPAGALLMLGGVGSLLSGAGLTIGAAAVTGGAAVDYVRADAVFLSQGLGDDGALGRYDYERAIVNAETGKMMGVAMASLGAATLFEATVNALAKRGADYIQEGRFHGSRDGNIARSPYSQNEQLMGVTGETLEDLSRTRRVRWSELNFLLERRGVDPALLAEILEMDIDELRAGVRDYRLERDRASGRKQETFSKWRGAHLDRTVPWGQDPRDGMVVGPGRSPAHLSSVEAAREATLRDRVAAYQRGDSDLVGAEARARVRAARDEGATLPLLRQDLGSLANTVKLDISYFELFFQYYGEINDMISSAIEGQYKTALGKEGSPLNPVSIARDQLFSVGMVRRWVCEQYFSGAGDPLVQVKRTDLAKELSGYADSGSRATVPFSSLYGLYKADPDNLKAVAPQYYTLLRAPER